MTVEIVVLAMIAAFLGLRLYSVLGRRAEQEEEPIRGRMDAKPGLGGIAPVHAPRRDAEAPAQVQNPAQKDTPLALPAVERALREISAVDRKFDVTAFVEGAQGAYRMILEAFWRGDKDELSQLCDKDVYDSFVTAIDARAAAGEALDNRLVRIEDTIITAAALNGTQARVTVRFTADIAAVTRNAEGTVIAGSLDDAVQTVDVWTFSRDTRSSDPDWLLDETDEG